jgi:hypothetical protein
MANLRKRIAANRTPRSENDSVWKETVKEDFPTFMQLFFAPEAEDIDWNKPHKFLDADLRRLTVASKHKNRIADKLVRVEYKNGRPGFLLIHLELQSYKEVEFARRMFIYFYRIFENNVELEEGDLITIVLLTKEEAAETKDRFEYKKGRFELLFKYPLEKLWEYQSRRAEFEASNNFFYLLIAIHLRALEAKNQQQMYDTKLEFYTLLLEKGFAGEDVVKLYKFLDWSIQMPKYLESRFTAAVEELERSKQVNYVTSAERLGVARGRKQGRRKGRAEGLAKGRVEGSKQTAVDLLLAALVAKFGVLEPEIQQQVATLSVDELKALLTASYQLETKQELLTWLANAQRG